MSKKQAWIGFWLLGIIWGSSFLLIRVAVRELTPFEVVFIRTAIAAVGLLLVAYARGKRLPTHWAGIRDLIILGVFNTVIPFALITWGEQSVESGLASVLQGTAALFTLVIAHFAFADERITLQKLAGLALGFGGVLLLASRSWQDGQIITSDLTGQLAIVAASLFYGLGGTYGRRVMQRGIEPIITAAGAMLTSAIVTGAFVFLPVLLPGLASTAAIEGATQAGPFAVSSPDVLLAAVVLGLFNTFVAYIIFYSILQALGAAKTSMVTYIVPAVGLTLGALFLDEIVDFRLLLGAALIIGGIGVVNLRFGSWLRRRREARQGA